MSLNTTIRSYEDAIRGDAGLMPGVTESDVSGVEGEAAEVEIDADWEARWLQDHVHEVQEALGEPTRERRSVALEALKDRIWQKWCEYSETHR